jgi:hypothetical protein
MLARWKSVGLAPAAGRAAFPSMERGEGKVERVSSVVEVNTRIEPQCLGRGETGTVDHFCMCARVGRVGRDTHLCELLLFLNSVVVIPSLPNLDGEVDTDLLTAREPPSRVGTDADRVLPSLVRVEHKSAATSVVLVHHNVPGWVFDLVGSHGAVTHDGELGVHALHSKGKPANSPCTVRAIHAQAHVGMGAGIGTHPPVRTLTCIPMPCEPSSPSENVPSAFGFCTRYLPAESGYQNGVDARTV